MRIAPGRREAGAAVRSLAAFRGSERLKRAMPYAVVLVAGAYLYSVAAHFDFERVPGRLGPDAWPKLVLGLTILVAACGIAMALLSRGAGDNPPASDEQAEAAALTAPPEVYPHLVWAGVAAALAYLLALPVIGFFLATCAFTAALIWLGQYRNWRHILILSPIVALVFMFLFMRVVYVALPIGEGWFARLSLAIMAVMGVR